MSAPVVARRKAPVAPARHGSRVRPWMLVAAAVAVIALTAGVILLATSSGGTDAPSVSQTATVSVAGTALPAYPGTGTDAAVSMPVPDVRGTDFNGTPVGITADGHAKVIIGAAHWCPHCQRELPILISWLAQHPQPALEIVLVSTAVSPDRDNYPPSDWLTRIGWAGPVLRDDASNSAAAALGILSFPSFTVEGSDGKVVVRDSGELSTAQFAALVAQAR